ncbi:hypothetical protein M3J09_002050 [Ascochyta lentis]
MCPSKIKCDSNRPVCLNCRRRNRLCTYSYVRQSGRPRRIRSAQSHAGASRKPVEGSRDDGRPNEAGQCNAATTTAAPSSSPSFAGSSALPASHHSENRRRISASGFDLAPENTIADFLDLLAMPDLDHSISAEYLTLEPDETLSSLGTGDNLPKRTCEDTFMDIEQSPTMVDQSAPHSSPSTDSSQLEQGLQNLLDDSNNRQHPKSAGERNRHV